MAEIPIKIQQELQNDIQLQWVEVHDRIYDELDLVDKLKLENQYLFWKKNCDIRKAINEIEAMIRSTSKPSVRLGGWSEIARIANCDRNTLKHPERFLWVNEAREKLITIIHQENSIPVKLEVLLTEEDNIQKLNHQLELSKTESARWFVKFEESERENKILKQALERQMAANNELLERIKNLTKGI